MVTELPKVRPIFLLTVATLPGWRQARLEVASIKPSPPGATVQDGRFQVRGDRFEVTAATVGDILDMLNRNRLYRVVGGPAWIRTDRFNIRVRKTPATLKRAASDETCS